MISFTIDVDPHAKGRPRFGNGRAYTDAKTRKWEKYFTMAARAHKPLKPFTGPVSLDVTFFIQRPKSVKRLAPICRPDIDNFLKATMDAMHEFWVDDAQVIYVSCAKGYDALGHINVRVWEV